MSTKERMTTARDLIREKQYDQARAILVTIDHPKAEEWLAKIDQISPPKANPIPQYEQKQQEHIPDWISAIEQSEQADDELPFITPPTNAANQSSNNDISMAAAIAIIGAVVACGAMFIGAVWVFTQVDFNMDSILGSCPRNVIADTYYIESAGPSGDIFVNQPTGGFIGDVQPGDIWNFQAESGQTIVVNMTSNNFDTLLQLYDADDCLLAENDDFNGTDARIRHTFSEGGTYKIVAAEWASDIFVLGGEYQISITPG